MDDGHRASNGRLGGELAGGRMGGGGRHASDGRATDGREAGPGRRAEGGRRSSSPDGEHALLRSLELMLSGGGGKFEVYPTTHVLICFFSCLKENVIMCYSMCPVVWVLLSFVGVATWSCKPRV